MTQPPKRKSGTAPDARGEPRPVISVNDLFRDPRMGDPQFAAVVERAIRLKLVDFRIGVGMAMAVAVACVLAVMLRVFPGALGFAVSPYFGGAIPGVVSVVVMLWIMRRSEKRRAPEVARILLADALCPSCSYGLAKLPPEQDGCTICPECGSAWRADHITRHTHYKENPRDMPRARGFAVLWHDGIGTGALRLKDETGTDRPLVSPRLRRQIAAAVGERKARLTAAARRNRRCGVFARVPIAALYIAIAVIGPWLAFHYVPNRLVTLAAIGLAVVFVAFGVCVLRGSIGVSAPWVKREMLLKGLCPSCAAALPHATAAPLPQDSATCPECQARWTSPALAMWRTSALPHAPPRPAPHEARP